MIETLTAIVMLASGPTTLPPPAKYDYPATNMEVVYDTPLFVSAMCGRVDAEACVKVELDDDGNVKLDDNGNIPSCIIVLPYSADEDSILYRHEQAHCNGWPADHPAD